jgi:hypothetical protein
MRRRKARAKQRSDAPSEAAATSGASKQRHHLPSQQEHADKLETIPWGEHVSATWASTSSTARPRPPGRNRCRLRTAAEPPGAGPRPERGDRGALQRSPTGARTRAVTRSPTLRERTPGQQTFQVLSKKRESEGGRRLELWRFRRHQHAASTRGRAGHQPARPRSLGAHHLGGRSPFVSTASSEPG